MIAKLSQIELVPGKLLILPHKAQGASLLYVPTEDRDGSTGVVVACNPRDAPMPDTYDAGPGGAGTSGGMAQKVGKRLPRLGERVIYIRVSSQPIALEGADGSVDNYRIVSEDDLIGYVND